MIALLILFEVMDKEWSLRSVWLIFLSLGLIGLLLTVWRRWLLVPALLTIGLVAAALLSEIRDPLVGPAIAIEAGRGYLTQSYVAIMISAVLPLLGLRRRRRRVSP